MNCTAWTEVVPKEKEKEIRHHLHRGKSAKPVGGGGSCLKKVGKTGTGKSYLVAYHLGTLGCRRAGTWRCSHIKGTGIVS